MAFKNFFTNTPCIICGKISNSIQTQKSMYNIDTKYVSVKDQAILCSECFDLLSVTKRLISLGKGITSKEHTQEEIINTYKELQPLLVKKTEAVTLSWLRDDLTEMITTAGSILYYNDNFVNIVHAAYCKIQDVVDILPARKAVYGLSIFAANEKEIFYVSCGRLEHTEQELLSYHDVAKRIGTAQNLERSIINNNNLLQHLDLEQIIYFCEKGDVQYTTEVSGGGGGEVNMSGAVLGGALFGVAGAIVGSKTGDKAGIKDIHSQTMEHDGRYTVIRYKDENGQIIEKSCEHGYYNVFNALIPEKEYSYIQLHSNVSDHDTPSTSNGIPVEELKKLKELLDAGVINEDDFEKTKKRLLQID